MTFAGKNNATISEIARRADCETGDSVSSSGMTATDWGWKRVVASDKRTEKESAEGVSDSYVREI